MKLSTYTTLACSVSVISALALNSVMADPTAPSSSSTPPSTQTPGPSPTPTPPAKHPFFRALHELDLTPAQKQQIEQIMKNTPDKKQRRQAIINVLTPPQKAKLKQLMAQYRAEHGE